MPRGSLAACGIVGTVIFWCLPIDTTGQQPKPAIQLESDVVFGKGGTTELKLDLAMPAQGEGPFPAIVCIHAGGWIGGRRQQMKETIEVFARRGFVAISPDYRLAPRDRFPAQIHDCKAAVRWLRANAEKYRVDSSRIGVFGASAGAHLACLLGVTNKDDGLEGEGGNAEQSSAVQAVVSFFGPTDLTQDVWSKEVRANNLLPLLGGTFAEKGELYRKASPLTYAGKNAPPFLFVHGTEDAIVPIKQSRDLAEKLRQAGASARLAPMEGAGNGQDWRGEQVRESLALMLDFFNETLKK
jgi:acetyl esterase/lipase